MSTGYVLKGAGQEDLLRATRAVAGGQAMLGTGVARRLPAPIKAAHPGGGVFPELTARRREVLVAGADELQAGRDPATGARSAPARSR